MRRVTVRLAVGFALVLLITGVLAGAVATSAAITIELSDGDRCETGGESDVGSTATPGDVTSLAGNVTKCIADGATDASDRSPPTGHE